MAKGIGNLQTRLKALEEQFEKLRHQRLAEQEKFQAAEGIQLARIGQVGGATGVQSNSQILALTALAYFRQSKSLEDPEQRARAMMKCGWLIHTIFLTVRGQPKELVDRELAGVPKELAEVAKDVLPRYVKILPLFRSQN